MKSFQIEVSEQAEEFYLSTMKGWVKVAGHCISINDLKFSAVPFSGRSSDSIRVSEIESGAKLFDVSVSNKVQSYEETMAFLEINVAISIVKVIEKIGIEKMRKQVKRMAEISLKKHGEKPFTTVVDIDNYNSPLH